MNWTTWFWTCHLELVISTSLCHRFARVLDKGRVTLARVFAEAVLDLNGHKGSARRKRAKHLRERIRHAPPSKLSVPN